MSTRVILAAWYAGVIAISLLTTNCARTPKAPVAIVDEPCAFHRANPHSSAIVSALWEACAHGDKGACEAYGDLVRQGPWEGIE